ncbi:MAG: gamma-glutamylcyclotransferase [Planctomycetota bacterium]
MPPTPDLLFVYGTLRPGLARGLPRTLTGDLEVVGAATVPGTLHDLGAYPGLVPGPSRVHGELLRITDDERLAAIDAYEECGGATSLFRRERVEATLADGTRRDAWAYLYNRAPGRAPVIPDGDYAGHRRGR